MKTFRISVLGYEDLWPQQAIVAADVGSAISAYIAQVDTPGNMIPAGSYLVAETTQKGLFTVNADQKTATLLKQL